MTLLSIIKAFAFNKRLCQTCDGKGRWWSRRVRKHLHICATCKGAGVTE